MYLKETAMKRINKNRGFSLIELLIVVVVIALVAAIAIPNLLASRRASNEASALSALRAISGAQAVYQTSTGNNNYGTAAQLYNQRLIDRSVAAANNVNVGGNPATNTAKAGYRFRIQTTAFVPATGVQATYILSAIPATTSGLAQTGAKRYCMTNNGLLKAATASLGTHFTAATCNSATAFRP
jgi:prepilin-type N-terminal cleavage/methylation domain-containing protein